MTNVEYRAGYELAVDTTCLALTGELRGVYGILQKIEHV